MNSLPPDVIAALDRIARELTDMPREFCRDFAEQIHWRARLARRLRAVAASTARSPVALPLVQIARSPPTASARALAQTVFEPTCKAAPLIERRAIVNRKGRTVRVEVRRARAAGQLEMPL